MTESSAAQALPFLGVTSDPLPMPPEMFAALGEIIVLWSRIESSIDADISTMMQFPVVRKLAKKAPRTFTQKLDLWRRCVRTLYPKIDAYQSYADSFDEAARKVAKVRNHVIHGSWGLQADESGGFMVTNIVALQHVERSDVIVVSIGFLHVLLNDMRTLDNHIISFICSKMWHAHQGWLKLDGLPTAK